MTKEQEDFLKGFKAGEYAELTVLINLVDIPQLIKVLQTSGIKLAMFPKVQAEVEYLDDNGKVGSS